MSARRALGAVAWIALSALACSETGPAEPVPDKPTWARDVLPILRGNCFGCHGSAVPCNGDADVVKPYGCRSGKTFWYIRHSSDFPAELKDVAEGMANARDAIDTILGPLRGPMGAAATRMPPPPADPLSDRDIEVLEKWKAEEFPKGQHNPNRRPQVRLVRKRLEGTVLKVEIDVLDGNDDQVLGKLRAGDVEAAFRSSGRQEVDLEGATMNAPLSYVVSDGWATVSGPLR